MADITAERINIQQEEVAANAAVSEGTASRLGASINFINERQILQKEFFVNRRYSAFTPPLTSADGAQMFLFDATIIGFMAFNLTAGSAGQTEFDVKRRTASGGSGTSIFSTTPKISYTAGNNAWVAWRSVPTPTTIENPSGTTVGVFSTTNVDAGDLITLDLLTVQTAAQYCGLIIYYIPR